VQWDAQDLPLRSGTVDLIMTDPPYVAEQVQLYEVLAREAMRVLRPGGFCLAMCGGHCLDRAMRWFGDAGLDYYWLYELGLGGAETGIVWMHGNRKVPVAVRTKHILVYSKGRSLSRCATTSLYWAGRADKLWHVWGQHVDSFRYYIDCFSKPGDLVLDPFGGGGTCAVACEILGREWVIGDLDPQAVATMVDRIYDDGREMHRYPLFAMEADYGTDGGAAPGAAGAGTGPGAA